MPPRELAHWRRAIGEGSALSKLRIETWVRERLLAEPPKIHPRVNRVPRYLRERLGSGEDCP